MLQRTSEAAMAIAILVNLARPVPQTALELAGIIRHAAMASLKAESSATTGIMSTVTVVQPIVWLNQAVIAETVLSTSLGRSATTATMITVTSAQETASLRSHSGGII
jgi:hypothetical protein